MFNFFKRKKDNSKHKNQATNYSELSSAKEIMKEWENVPESELSPESLQRKRLAEQTIQQAIQNTEYVANEVFGLRFNFYRDGSRRKDKTIMILIGALIISTAWNAYNTIKIQSQRNFFFTVDENNRIIPIVPANVPIVNNQQLMSWVSQALTEIYAMDGVNYRQVTDQRIPRYFTRQGLESYKRTLTDSGRIQFLKDNSLIMNAVPASVPVILDQGVINGQRYYWRVRVPLHITYKNNTQRAEEVRIVTLLITRENTANYRDGIAINQLLESDSSSEIENR